MFIRDIHNFTFILNIKKGPLSPLYFLSSFNDS
jgi:hypothetical protein